MKNNNQRGISLINVVLLTFIMIAIFAIVIIIIQNSRYDGNENYIIVENSISNNYKSDVINNGIENISLNANILNANITQEYTKYGNYYYNQLEQYSKSMYSSIMSNISEIKSGYGTIEFDINQVNMESKFQTAWDAICLDKPELFYIDTKKLCLTTQTTTSLLGKVNYKYVLKTQEGQNYFLSTWQNEKAVKDAINQVESISNNVVKTASGTIYDKVKYIHDYIINNISYDQNNTDNNSNIYGTLVNKTAICEGYAETFKYLLDQLNIPCVIVYGDGINGNGESEFHAWNEVKMEDGNWYAVDTTWDDPIIIGGGTLSNVSKYKNFLKGSKSFFMLHKNESDVSGTGQNFSYPILSENDYE